MIESSLVCREGETVDMFEFKFVAALEKKLGEGEGRWGCTQGTAMSAVRAIYDRAGTDMKKARRRHR